MSKRILLGVGLFLLGALLGFEVAWLTRFLQPSHGGASGPASSPSVEITLSAIIDGSDRFSFTRDNVVNEHGRWGAPKDVMFNGLPWPDLSAPPEGWLELAAELDLSRATITSREGRDTIALEPKADGFDLYFADTQMGAGKYAVTVSIPKK